jgi:hypothetical protein
MFMTHRVHSTHCRVALDSFTEALAQEVLPAWNIRVRDSDR